MYTPLTLRGPLGSHVGFLQHIALKNVLAHYWVKREHAEKSDITNQAKYEELRLFLNAVESLNNVLDYFYFEYEYEYEYEYEDQLNSRYSTVQIFRSAVHNKFPALQNLADLANAYKHCIRTRGKTKNENLPNAKDMQHPSLIVSIELSDQNIPKVEVDYFFNWPILDHEKTLEKAVDFWVACDVALLLNA